MTIPGQGLSSEPRQRSGPRRVQADLTLVHGGTLDPWRTSEREGFSGCRSTGGIPRFLGSVRRCSTGTTGGFSCRNPTAGATG